MKKLLITILAFALIISFGACKKNTDDTDTLETNEAEETVITGETGYEEINDPDAPNETATIREGGTEAGLWPAEELPESIPAYEDYSYMYAAKYEDYDTSENWYLCFDSTEDEYNEYVAQLDVEGYRKSDRISGFWGNGEQILDLFTETVDGEFCVNIDIIKSKSVEYPAAVTDVFPTITVSDSTLYGWYIVDNEDGTMTLSVAYVCGYNFASDLEAFKTALAEAGFDVGDDLATIDVDGRIYYCEYGDGLDAYEDRIDFTYYAE